MDQCFNAQDSLGRSFFFLFCIWVLVSWTALRPRGSWSSAYKNHRRILFFPYGNHADYASFYLEHAWEEEPPENWYACVQFALVLSNVNDPSIYVSHCMLATTTTVP